MKERGFIILLSFYQLLSYQFISLFFFCVTVMMSWKKETQEVIVTLKLTTRKRYGFMSEWCLTQVCSKLILMSALFVHLS